MRRSALNASSLFVSSAAPGSRARGAAAKALSASLSALLVVQSTGLAWAAGDSATPAEVATFDDARPNAQAAAGAVGSANTRKAHGVPVSSSGTFATSIAIDVPPGRAGMQPSLALSYDSGSAHPSAVGAGFSFGAPRIARSTKQGFLATLPLRRAPQGRRQQRPERAADRPRDSDEGFDLEIPAA